MKKFFFCFLLITIGNILLGENISLSKNDVEMGKFGTYQNGVFIVNIPKTPGISCETRGITFRLPLKKFEGKWCTFRAELRATNIQSDVTDPYWGGKILGFSRSLDTSTFFTDAILRGNTDWKKVSIFCDFPPELETGWVCFGIQQGWGKLEIRNIEYEFYTPPSRQCPENFRCEYSPEIQNLPMYRGMMSPVPNKITKEDIQELGRWGVNLLRYQIVDGITSADTKDRTKYIAWIDRCLDKLDELMPILQENKIKVIIDMHHVPGGRYMNHGVMPPNSGAAQYKNSARFLMMDDPTYRQIFLDVWKNIAARYKGNANVYGYDLMNEPSQRGPAIFDYWSLQYDAAAEIRKIDEETPILVESNSACSPAEYKELIPLPFKNIFYQIHMYGPYEYTHQGVRDQYYLKNYPATARPWPDNQKNWNKKRLYDALESTLEFSKKYNAKIIVGEFSAIAWAPGAEEYLRDLTAIFEEYQWDWCYHAFREWTPWSLEHNCTPPNQFIPVKRNPRKDVILDRLKHNFER